MFPSEGAALSADVHQTQASGWTHDCHQLPTLFDSVVAGGVKEKGGKKKNTLFRDRCVFR